MKLPALQTLGTGIVVLTVGLVIGLFIPQDGLRSAVIELGNSSLLKIPAAEVHADEQTGEDHTDHVHVELSKPAQKSLGLKRQALTPTSYVARTSIPCSVVERPAISDLHVVTVFEGIIEEIHAVPGQAIRESDLLFRIRLTGDALASAQAAFLDAVQQLDIQDREITRLEQAAEGGGLARKDLLQQQYERSRIAAQQETRHQELIIRGLTDEQIKEIVKTRKLIRTVDIVVPTGLVDHSATTKSSDPWLYTIEELLVTPGLLVRPGDPLCNLAYHSALYLEGMAFERDVDAVTALLKNQTAMEAELGQGRHPIELTDLQIVHLSNHVDPQSQGYRFYLELDNQVVQENITAEGRRFRSWQFKPGQRGHIFLPQNVFEKIYKVPADAVVNDGLENIVFRYEAAHNHDDHADDHVEETHEDHSQHEEQSAVDVFEPVNVEVIYKDRRYAVIARGGELLDGNVIAANAAYQLLLETKSGDGGGHDHGHDH